MPNATTKSSIKSPIIGVWAVNGQPDKHPGVLIVEDERAYLNIFSQIEESAHPAAIGEHPRLAPFRPPNRPNIRGETTSLGRVTLFNCAQTAVSATIQLQPPKSYVELTLLASQAWAGASFLTTPQNTKS